MKKKIMNQERLLTAHTQHEKNTDSAIDQICAKTNRKKEDLLMNKIDAYRMKKQVLEIVENKKSLAEKYGDKSRYIGLRRPDNFKGTRYTLFNGGSDQKPHFFSLKEQSETKVVNIQRPMTCSAKDFKRFSSGRYFKKATQQLKLNVEDLVEANQLFIEGHDLIEEEKQLIKRFPGKKLLYNLGDKIDKQKLPNYQDQENLTDRENQLLDIQGQESARKESKTKEKDKEEGQIEEVIAENYDYKNFLKYYRVKSSK